MKLSRKNYTDEHGEIWYGLQFGHRASRPVWEVIKDGDDPAAGAIIAALATFGGVPSARPRLTEATVAHLVRTAKDKRSDAWVGWRYIKAALLDMPDAEAEDLIWVMMVENKVEHALAEKEKP